MDSKAKTKSLILAILAKWTAQIPESLLKEDPLILLRLLDCVDGSDGVSQGQLVKHLGIRQPRLSKLIQKLIAENCLYASTPRENRSLQILTSTSSGNALLYHLESMLSEPLVRAYGVEIEMSYTCREKPFTR